MTKCRTRREGKGLLRKSSDKNSPIYNCEFGERRKKKIMIEKGVKKKIPFPVFNDEIKKNLNYIDKTLNS